MGELVSLSLMLLVEGLGPPQAGMGGIILTCIIRSVLLWMSRLWGLGGEWGVGVGGGGTLGVVPPISLCVTTWKLSIRLLTH